MSRKRKLIQDQRRKQDILIRFSERKALYDLVLKNCDKYKELKKEFSTSFSAESKREIAKKINLIKREINIIRMRLLELRGFKIKKDDDIGSSISHFPTIPPISPGGSGSAKQKPQLVTLEMESEYKFYCKYCGNKLAKNQKFCNICGKKCD